MNLESDDIQIKISYNNFESYIKGYEDLNQKLQNPYYMSPEFLHNINKMHYGSVNYAKNGNELWSIGILLHFLLLEQMHYSGESSEEIKKNIYLKNPSFVSNPELIFENSPKETEELLKGLLEYNAQDRITVKKALKLKCVKEKPQIKKAKMNTMNDLINNKYFSSPLILKENKKLILKKDISKKNGETTGSQVNISKNDCKIDVSIRIREFIKQDKIHFRVIRYIAMYNDLLSEIKDLLKIVFKQNSSIRKEKVSLSFARYQLAFLKINGRITLDYELKKIFDLIEKDNNELYDVINIIKVIIKESHIFKYDYFKKQFYSCIDKNKSNKEKFSNNNNIQNNLINVNELLTLFQSYNNFIEKGIKNFLVKLNLEFITMDFFMKLLKKELLYLFMDTNESKHYALSNDKAISVFSGSTNQGKCASDSTFISIFDNISPKMKKAEHTKYKSSKKARRNILMILLFKI